MVPKPISYDSYSSDEFENEAPEAVTFSSSKDHAKKLRNARDAAVADAKRKLRDRRRQAMQKTRQEAQRRKEDTNQMTSTDQVNSDNDEGGPEERARELQARMDRAMADAAGEESEENEDELDEKADDGRVGFNGDEGDSGSEGDSVDEELDEDVDEVVPERDYLPDHIFSEALSKIDATRSTSTSKKPAKESPAGRASKRKSKKKAKSEDVVIGSKTIRTESRKHPVVLAASRNKQPKKVKRFVDTSLGLKGSKQSKRCRSRQPANIGIMRSHFQPAFGFVRGS